MPKLTVLIVVLFLSLIAFLRVSVASTTSVEQQAAASVLLKKALDAKEIGKFNDARSLLERVQHEYGSLVDENDMEDSKTFGEEAELGLKNLTCLEEWESGSKNSDRTEQQTLNQLLDAVQKQEIPKVRSLISCGIYEGVPQSEMDATKPDETTLRLLGKKGGDGYAPVPGLRNYKVIKLKSSEGSDVAKTWILQLGSQEMEITIQPSKHAPKTSRITQILWPVSPPMVAP